MRRISQATVNFNGRMVGTLAEAKNGEVAFQYSPEWLADGFSISPLSLPLENRVFFPKSDCFEGLIGIFADSLPDGWGRLLVDRMFLSKNIAPAEVRPIERLCVVGKSGMGALEYVPELFSQDEAAWMDYDELARECEKVLGDQPVADIDRIVALGGSSGGARPKALVDVEGEPWIVKFPTTDDRKNVGEEEYRYMRCAKDCHIRTPEVGLIPSKRTSGYFCAKRFDRENGAKIHMASAAAILETSHRTPNLDYHDLMKLTYILTRDSCETEELYRRMCFNVFAHNRDDHAKNFSYLYDEGERRWKLSPAYDLTYSNSLGGEHATCVNGNGANPGREDLYAVGRKAGIAPKKLRQIADEVEEIVLDELGDILRK